MQFIVIFQPLEKFQTQGPPADLAAVEQAEEVQAKALFKGGAARQLWAITTGRKGAIGLFEAVSYEELQTLISSFPMVQKKYVNDAVAKMPFRFLASEDRTINEDTFTANRGTSIERTHEADILPATNCTRHTDLPTPSNEGVRVDLTVNGVGVHLSIDSRVMLLDALRERLDLTGTKKGCDHGQCGVCTVLIDGRRELSCLTLFATCDGRDVTTIEGVARGSELHPLQQAFITRDAFQCGFCTSGQICSMLGLMDEAKRGDLSFVTRDVREAAKPLRLSDDEIKERLSGNICRCGAYLHLLAAYKDVQGVADAAGDGGASPLS